MSGWRWNQRVASILVVVFLVVQLALPVVLMLQGSDRALRFGWQMFSRAAPATEFVAVTAAGEIRVSPEDVLARARGDLNLEAIIPPFLCERHGASRVYWEGGEHRC